VSAGGVGSGETAPRSDETAHLARHGFRSPQDALRELPAGWNSDERWRELVHILGDTADPDAGLRRLQRLGERVVERALADVNRARPLLVLLGFSDYLTDLLVRTPGLPPELIGARASKRDDLHEFRDAGFVRIAANDLANAPDEVSFRRTGAALAELADGCVARFLSEGGRTTGLSVMAMGKYGGEELNYASDIDVLFVVRDQASVGQAERAARELIQRLTGPPTLFRVDADLRPQGRDGPLVRTLDAYRAYYERWAHVWEFQALIKCRFAAGDTQVGADFMELIQPFVWPEELAAEAIEQVRELKARAEREVARRGLATEQVKLGRGGIRDVEFAVQLLQLVHGRHHPELRIRSTLDALAILAAEGYVGETDAADLSDAYVFLRHTEHRLQLDRGRQTHTLPPAGLRREHLARGLGFRDTDHASAEEAFEQRWVQVTAVVRTIHERLFYRPLLEAFTGAPAVRPTLSNEEADERLAALGFDRPPRARGAVATLTSGSTRRAKLMRALLPAALSWMAETPEPDQGMLRLVDVAKQLDPLPHLLAVLRDEPPVAELLCKALGTGPVLAAMLERDASLIGALSEDRPRDVPPRDQAIALTRRARERDEAVTALRRFKDGAFLRLATHDLSAGDEPEVFVRTGAELSDVGDACLEATVEVARREQAEEVGGVPPGGFSIVAMGRYGGRELSYASDLDVMFVYERDEKCPDGSEARLFHSNVAERVMRLLGSVPPIFRVDAEVRPEGRNGPIVRSLESYLLYYDRWASLWEFQALTRARHAAGDRSLTSRLLDSVAPRVWRPTLTGAEVAEIRRMKVRIERERLGPRQDPRLQMKLGTGGLNDVEFTVQLLQMSHAYRIVEARTGNTLAALEALHEAGVVEDRDFAWLRDAYLLLNRVRNHLFLLRGLVTDALPTRDEELERLARSLGYGRLSRSRFLEHYRRVTRRARRVTNRLFYGEES
jgi:glutamate-ammonia-ligase adenylyltransferase